MEQKTYGVWAVRGSGSVFGAAQAWCKEDGKETVAPPSEKHVRKGEPSL